MIYTPTTFRYLGSNPDRHKYLIIDATRPIVFKAIQADYKKGICGDVEKCALSRALKRFDSGVLKVFTGKSIAYIVYISAPYTAVRFEIPGPHGDAIDAFDRTGYLAPGTYRFKVLSPSRRIGYVIGSNENNNVSGIIKEVQPKLNPIKRSSPTRRVTGK